MQKTGLREKKGFWTNGESEFAKKNNGFDSNSVSDLIGEKEKNMGFDKRWNRNLPKKWWVW